MKKDAIIISIIGILTWWIPLGPVPILLPAWGIIVSQEAYQMKDRLAFSLSLTALILAVGAFMFDTVTIVYTTLAN